VVGIGTETDGSITCPASVNGLVGIKPTVGLWSRSGIIPISATQDTAGPMARTVKDAAIFLGVCTGEDPKDAITKESVGKTKPNYAEGLDGKGLQGKRIGVDLQRRSKHHQLNALLDAALEDLKKQGAVIVEVEYVEAIDKLGEYETRILQYEFKDGVNKYLAGANAKVKTLAEVIAFNKANEDKAMPFFKQEQLENCEKTEGLDAAAYKEAFAKGTFASRKILADLMEKHQLDAITGLTMGPGCAIDSLYGDRYSNDFLTGPAAMAGYPHISVPAGQVFGMPVGLSLFGAPYTEHALIKMAYTYEQATKKRAKPGFKHELPWG
jgi:amidase